MVIDSTTLAATRRTKSTISIDISITIVITIIVRKNRLVIAANQFKVQLSVRLDRLEN